MIEKGRRSADWRGDLVGRAVNVALSYVCIEGKYKTILGYKATSESILTTCHRATPRHNQVPDDDRKPETLRFRAGQCLGVRTCTSLTAPHSPRDTLHGVYSLAPDNPSFLSSTNLVATLFCWPCAEYREKSKREAYLDNHSRQTDHSPHDCPVRCPNTTRPPQKRPHSPKNIRPPSPLIEEHRPSSPLTKEHSSIVRSPKSTERLPRWLKSFVHSPIHVLAPHKLHSNLPRYSDPHLFPKKKKTYRSSKLASTVYSPQSYSTATDPTATMEELAHNAWATPHDIARRQLEYTGQQVALVREAEDRYQQYQRGADGTDGLTA